MPLDFRDCQLMISARSPFARRVRLAFHERGIPFTEKVVDVLKGSAELNAINPLARVPVAVLKSGEIIAESGVILRFLAEAHPGPLWPSTLSARMEAECWSTYAVGLSEKIVEYFFETLRPEHERDPVLLKEVGDIITRVLQRLEEKLLQSKTAWVLGDSLTQVDLDLGTALAYINLRYSTAWRESYPRTAAYLAALEKRPAFQATVPPPA